jgi:hypothetical protein
VPDAIDRTISEAARSITRPDPAGTARAMSRFRENCERMNSDPEYAEHIRRIAGDLNLAGLERGFTVQLPYSCAIARGFKPVENRPKKLPDTYAGIPLALHSSLKHSGVMALPDRDATQALLDAEMDHDPLLAPGSVIAVITFTGCHPAGECEYRGRFCDPWATAGGWHWIVGETEPLAAPVKARGNVTFWPLPGDVKQAVREQLEERA